MSQTMREALEWTAAALQEVFRTNHNCSEHDRIVIGGSSATVREILNHADAALSAPSSEQAQQGVDKTWATYVAGIIDTYLESNPAKDVRASAIAGIIERRMVFASRPAVVSDAQIDGCAELHFTTLNQLTPTQWRGFARRILALAGAAQGAEPVGGAERWMAIVREKADDARKNAQGLRQFEGMEAEARARELAAQYLLETAHVMVLDERHAEALAGIVDQSGRIAELRAALTTAARAAEPAIHLGAEGQKVFAETLLNPPPPTAAFLKAEESYSNLVRPEATAPAGGVTLREALQFYANGDHFMKSDPDAWDTVSGEPANLWCDEAGTATVEDGSIARAALTTAARAAEPDMVQQCMAIINAAWAAIPEHLRVDDGTDPTGNPLPTAVRALAARAAEPARLDLSGLQRYRLSKTYHSMNRDPEGPYVQWDAVVALAASPTPPTGTEKKDAEPVVHQGMTIAGDGAAMLGRLMREQRASRLGVYPDGNPNAGTEKP